MVWVLSVQRLAVTPDKLAGLPNSWGASKDGFSPVDSSALVPFAETNGRDGANFASSFVAGGGLCATSSGASDVTFGAGGCAGSDGAALMFSIIRAIFANSKILALLSDNAPNGADVC